MSLNAFHRWRERRRIPPPPPLCLAPLLSMRHLIVSSFRRAFGFQAYGCQECCCCGSWLYLSSSSIRAKILTHLSRAIVRYSPDVNIPQLWLLIRSWFCSCLGRLSCDWMDSVCWGFCVTAGNRAPFPVIRALILLSSLLPFPDFNVWHHQFH